MSFRRRFRPKDQSERYIKGHLSEAETSAILKMRSLGDVDRLTIRRTKSKDEVLLDVERAEPLDDDFATKLGSLVEGDFLELSLIKRDGRIVNLKKSETHKVKS